jgi:hypothetical protein
MTKMKATRLIATAGLLLCLGASRAAAQDGDRLQRARSGLPASAAARLDRILQTAAAQGLPTAALVDKTLEGEAKGVPGDRILDVVAVLAVNLGRARSILLVSGSADGDEVTAAADALRRGVPEANIRALRVQQRGRPFALPVVTLADVEEQGVPGDRALALLAAWNHRGADPAELRELPAAIERLIRNGTLPAQAAITVTAAITGSPGDAAAVSGKSDMAPGHLKGDDRPPVSPGAGPPPGKGRKTSHPGKG